ncbi:unnamed protein product [Effrenium voratum]|nr:unnamed protein product [Effrenium voratum]
MWRWQELQLNEELQRMHRRHYQEISAAYGRLMQRCEHQQHLSSLATRHLEALQQFQQQQLQQQQLLWLRHSEAREFLLRCLYPQEVEMLEPGSYEDFEG